MSHPLEYEIARLEGELELKRLELKFVKAKSTDGGASKQLRAQLATAREAWRSQYPPRVTVAPQKAER